MENQTEYNISSSKETVNTTNASKKTTQKLSTSGMATSITTKYNSKPSTTHGDKQPSSTPVTSHSEEQTTHEYYVLHHFTGFAQNVPVRPHIPRHSNHHLNLGMCPLNFIYWLKKEITIIQHMELLNYMYTREIQLCFCTEFLPCICFIIM